MNHYTLSVRELCKDDIEPLTQYWLNANGAFLKNMGVDVNKMPSKDEWISMLTGQLNTPLKQKQSYCIIWLLNDVAVGHSNINKIKFGNEAYMHLHMWQSNRRQHGLGTALVRLTIPHFFNKYNLQKLCCEPYALNAAPNKTLAKAGFAFIKTYTTTPGWLNFEQPVNLWEMTYEKFKALQSSSIA